MRKEGREKTRKKKATLMRREGGSWAASCRAVEDDEAEAGEEET